MSTSKSKSKSKPKPLRDPVHEALIERSGDVKRELLALAKHRRYAREFQAAYAARFGDLRADVDVDDVEALANFLDYFVLEHPLRNGETVLMRYIAAHPQLPEAERVLLHGWHDVVTGVFEVERLAGEALIVVSLLDDLTYQVRSNMGRQALQPLRPGAFLRTRLVPVGDEWLMSGVASVWPKSARAAAHAYALRYALLNPQSVFRNPAKLEQGWKFQRAERQKFIDYFGADLIVLPGSDVAERMRDYLRVQTGGADLLEVNLADDFSEFETVGVIYDEVEGMYFVPDFGLVEDVFNDPNLVADRSRRQALLGFLESPDLLPLPLERLAARDPERASDVFRRALKRPTFDWARDGEALLRTHKPEHYATPRYPSVTPIGEWGSTTRGQ